MTKNPLHNDIAYLSYIGSVDNPNDCSEAIIDCLCRGDVLKKIRLLSSPVNEGSGTREHGFYLEFEIIGWFVVLPGYASGYGGKGPNELSRILSVLRNSETPLNEISLEQEEFGRLSAHCLTNSDIDAYHKSSDYRSGKSKVSDYFLEHTWELERSSLLLGHYAARLPLPLLHPSIQYLSAKIFADPQNALREAYILIETKIRDLSELSSHGTKLFDEALKPKKGILSLNNVQDSGEQAGFQNLIKGLYQLHRNPRMHRDVKENQYGLHSYISEFLVINHLLYLSDDLIKNPSTEEE